MSDEFDISELLEAIDDRDKKKIKKLIKQGADPNEADFHSDETPIMQAAAWGDIEVLKLLVEAGANLSDVDASGKTVLHFACSNYENDMVDPIVFLLEQGSFDINRSDEFGYTPLFYAAMYGNYTIALFLIERGANKSVKCKSGKTAYQLFNENLKKGRFHPNKFEDNLKKLKILLTLKK